MASPMAVPLSLNTAPTTTYNDHIESEDTGWQDEDTDEELGAVNNVEIPMDNDTPPDDCLLDTPDEEQEFDFGAPLSQHQPSLQWEETSFNNKEEEEMVEKEGSETLLPKSESQLSNWGVDSDDEGDEDEEGAPWEVEGDSAAEKDKGKNAKLLPLELVKKDFLSKLVTEAFSTSIFKNTAAVEEDQNANYNFFAKRQKTIMSTSDTASLSSQKPLKRHVCPFSCSSGSTCSPGMNPTCNFTHKTNNVLGKHIQVTCSHCKKSITTLRIGDIIKVEGTLGLIRSITKPSIDIGGGQQEKLLTLHLQLLSEELVLHTNCPNGIVTLPLLKQSMNSDTGKSGGCNGSGGSSRLSEPLRDTVLLKRNCRHQNITINELNNAWVHGRVDWLPQTSPLFPNIMFCDSNKTCDVKSVDLSSTSSCPQLPCSCLNPWKPTPLVLEPGDWVVLQPEEGKHHPVDSLNHLGRVVKVSEADAAGEGSSAAADGVGGNTFRGGRDAAKSRNWVVSTQIFFLRTEIASPETTTTTTTTTSHDYIPQKTIKDSSKFVLRKIDPLHDLPRGVRILDSNGEDILLKLASNPSVVPLPPPLECIDFFCGGGFLSKGLELSGAAKVILGVDGFYAATKTSQGAHPKAKIYCEDVCEFMMKNTKRLERDAGGNSKKDAAEGEKMNQDQQRPMRLLVGGPPCQGFSGANKSSPSQKLEKNVCMAIFTEAVSRLRPEFVIIENVKGLLRAPNGVLDSVILCLVSLGYQTRVRVVNAGSYGVAQNRVRVIILAAKHGLPLPEMPQPTHIFHAGGYNAKDPSQPCSMELRQKYAYAGVPVAWKPCVIVPTNALLPREDIRSIMGDLPLEDETGDVEYKSEPVSVFQANIRQGMTSNRVGNHQTNAWGINEDTEKRIQAIPKESDFADDESDGGGGDSDGNGGSNRRFEGRILACEHPQRPVIAGDWLDLPYDLLPDELKTALARTLMKNRCRFGRLMWMSHCSTILTQSGVQINSDTCGPVIHPEGNRVLTVREIARVQGIPDTVRIEGSLKEQYKQCGNGVPPPLAEAIGREIRKAVCQVYKRNASL